MRTTIRIDDDLLRAAKKLAASTDRTLTAVIEDALRLTLALSKKSARKRKVKLKTCGGNGPLPGVDLDDSASLLDLMESSDVAPRR